MKARLPEGVQMKRGDMMRQLQQMQAQMESTQTEVEESVFSATAGGGMVTAQVNGKKELLSIKIDPEVVDPDDVETLQDILVAGVNEAIKRVEETNSREMEKITGSMNMPGLF